MKRLLLLAYLLGAFSFSYITQLRSASDAALPLIARGERFITILLQLHDYARLDVIKKLSASDIKNAYDHLALQIEHPATQDQTGLMNTFQNEARRRLAQKLHCTADSLMDKTCQPLKNSPDKSLTPEERNAQPFKDIQEPWTNDWVNLLNAYEKYEHKMASGIKSFENALKDTQRDLLAAWGLRASITSERAKQVRLPIQFLFNTLVDKRIFAASKNLKNSLQCAMHKVGMPNAQPCKEEWKDNFGSIEYRLTPNSNVFFYGTLSALDDLIIGVRDGKHSSSYQCLLDDSSIEVRIIRTGFPKLSSRALEEMVMDAVLDMGKSIEAPALVIYSEHSSARGYKDDIAFFKSKKFEFIEHGQWKADKYRLDLTKE